MADAVYTIAVDAQGVVVGSNKAKAALRGVGVEAVGVDKNLGRASKSVSSFGGNLARLAAGYLSARTLLVLAQDSVQAALRMEAIDQKLKIATGSATAAAREMGFVRDVVDRLGLSLPESAEGFAKFSVALKGTSLEGEGARRVFESVAEASTVMRLTAEQTGGVFLALEQIVSKGTVSAEELRGQLGERLAGAFLTAADAMGVTTEKLGDMLQAGELTAEEFLPKFARALHEDFGEAAVEAADSAQAAFNRFNNVMFDVRTELGEQLLPKLTELAAKITEFAQSDEGEQAIRDLGDAMSDAAESAVQLVGAIAKLLSLGGGLADFLNSLTFGPDPDRLRQTAAVIERIERFLTFDQAGSNTAIAGRIRAYADELERLERVSSRSAEIKRIEAQISALDELGLVQEKNANRLKGIAAKEEEVARISEEAMKKAAEEAKRLADELDRLGDSARNVLEDLGIGNRELRELAEAELVLRDALEKGQISLGDFGAGLQALREESRRVQAELDKSTISIDKMKDALDRPVHTGVGGIADEVCAGIGTGAGVEAYTSAWEDFHDVLDSVYALGDLADALGLEDVSEGVDEFLGGLEDIVGLIDSLGKLGDTWDDIGKSITDAAANMGAFETSLLAVTTILGAIEGDPLGPTSSNAQYGGKGEGNYSEMGELVGAVIGAWIGGLIGIIIDVFTAGATVGWGDVAVMVAFTAIGAEIGKFLGKYIKHGADEGIAVLEQAGDEVIARYKENERGLGKVAEGFGRSALANLDAIVGSVGGLVEGIQQFEVKVRDGKVSVLVNGINKRFEEASDAMAFLVTQIAKTAELGGQIDEAVKQAIAGYKGDPEDFGDTIGFVDQLATQSRIAIDGLSGMEVEMERLGPRLNGLRSQLEALGLSAEQVNRLVGGQLVASFQNWRQQITGEGQSVEQRKAIQKAQAELFNAQITLEIARLEAERQALIAQGGLTEAEVQLGIGRLEAGKQFVNAQGKIFSANAELQKGFIEVSAKIVAAGASTLNKQIAAISKVIEALKKIGLIDIGSLKLPGLPKLPKGGGIGNIGGGGSTGPSLADQLRTLLDSLFPAEAEARRFEEQIQILDKSFEKGLITAERYQEALRLLREQMAEGIRDALEQLREFRNDLTGGERQGVGNQLIVAQREALRAFNAASEGDPSKVADFISANRDLLDLLSGTFGSGAGFQSGLREILKRTGALEDLFGDQLENVLADPARDTAQHTAQMVVHQMKIEQNTQSVAESSRVTAERTGRIENEARTASVQNQVGHGKTRTVIADLDKHLDKKLDDVARRFERAVERIKVA